jgi:hypothetical protein
MNNLYRYEGGEQHEIADRDEWHQTWRDALLMTAGALVGAVVVACIVVYQLSRSVL